MYIYTIHDWEVNICYTEVNICYYCLINSNRIPPKHVSEKKKKKLNADANSASINPKAALYWEAKYVT